MANTFTQIYMHIIFAVNHREAMIADAWADELYRYLAATCQHRNHFVYAINGTVDHIHLLIGTHPTESVSSLVKELKGQSSRWINQKFYRGTFSWQSGYGAFSYSRSMVPAVKKYVEHQREHHRHRSFAEELADIFHKAGIEAKPEYMMHRLE